MRYLCVHCDKTFDHEQEGKRPRCPICMRKHGLERIAEARRPTDPRPKSRLVVVGGIVVVAALITGGYFYWARETPDSVSGDVPLRPLERSELLGYARARRASITELAGLLEANDAIEALGERAGGGSAFEQADGVVEAIRARAQKRAFVTWSLTMPRETPIKTAGQVAELLARDNGRAKLYPLEVAAVAVAALRSAGVDAMVAEIYAFPGDRRPPDPSGHFGYFGVAVYRDEPGEGEPRIFDPYGGHGTTPEEDDVRVLTDLQVIGAALNNRASHQLVREASYQRAFDLSEQAARLDERSPAIHTVRGAVLIASGNAPEGIEEIRAAHSIRPDAPRRNNLAGVHIAEQDFDRAAREVGAALEIHRDYANGHATMAAIHLSRGENELARTSLETAERLDPDLFTLPMLWSNFYLATGDAEEAADHAAEAIRRRPRDWEVRLNAARVYRAAARYDDMRAEARRIMEMVPTDRRQDVRMLIEQLLGPTALEEPMAEEDLEDDGEDDGELPDSDFDLGSGSRLLGGDGSGSTMGGPSLLDDQDLRPSGDPSTLRLREPGSDLQLDIDEE